MKRSTFNALRPIKTFYSILIFEVSLILSSLTLSKASIYRRTVEVNQGAADGEEFVKRIFDGEKITDRPGYLVFTAPYRLCEGGCKDTNGNNFVLSFPLYIGMKGRSVYQETYTRDVKSIHHQRSNAPFKKRTTRMPFILTSKVTCQYTKSKENIINHVADISPQTLPANITTNITDFITTNMTEFITANMTENTTTYISHATTETSAIPTNITNDIPITNEIPTTNAIDTTNDTSTTNITEFPTTNITENNTTYISPTTTETAAIPTNITSDPTTTNANNTTTTSAISSTDSTVTTSDADDQNYTKSTAVFPFMYHANQDLNTRADIEDYIVGILKKESTSLPRSQGKCPDVYDICWKKYHTTSTTRTTPIDLQNKYYNNMAGFENKRNLFDMSLLILLTLPIFDSSNVDLPWRQWSWSAPQSPIQYFFRRNANENIPIKSPEYECQCPPSKECAIEFKINEKMADFLNIRGVLVGDAAEAYKHDVQELQKSSSLSPKELVRQQRLRRSNDETEDQCCCPPRTLMMPTFVTDTKFDEISERFNKKVVPPVM